MFYETEHALILKKHARFFKKLARQDKTKLAKISDIIIRQLKILDGIMKKSEVLKIIAIKNDMREIDPYDDMCYVFNFCIFSYTTSEEIEIRAAAVMIFIGNFLKFAADVTGISEEYWVEIGFNQYDLIKETEKIILEIKNRLNIAA